MGNGRVVSVLVVLGFLVAAASTLFVERRYAQDVLVAAEVSAVAAVATAAVLRRGLPRMEERVRRQAFDRRAARATLEMRRRQTQEWRRHERAFSQRTRSRR